MLYMIGTRYPENDQFAPEYVTIIPPTGTAYMTIVQKNVVQIVGMCTVLVGLVIIFVIKQKEAIWKQTNMIKIHISVS